MSTWFWYAIVAAVLYGLHQVFTKLAALHIGDGLGGFVVEATAALTIAIYLGWLWISGRWDQKAESLVFFIRF
jgi:transporter family protein